MLGARCFGLLPVMLLAACSYAPPERINRLASVLPDSSSDYVAIAVTIKVLQLPRGLLAFPDGGKPRVTEDAVELTICDERRHLVRRVGLWRPFAGVQTAFSALLAGWRADTLFVTLSGYDRELTGPDQRLLRRFYAATPTGDTMRIASLPPFGSGHRGQPRAFCTAAIDSIDTHHRLASTRPR